MKFDKNPTIKKYLIVEIVRRKEIPSVKKYLTVQIKLNSIVKT